METINERFIKLRKACEKNQTEFAKILGLSRSGITAIETGQRNVTEKHIIMLSNWKERQVNIEWLRTGKGEMFLKTPDTLIEQLKQKYSMDDFETSIVEEYLNLPADKRAVFKEFIYKLASKAQVAEKVPDEGTLRAAHARTDKKSTPEGQKHDWDIMMNDDEWE